MCLVNVNNEEQPKPACKTKANDGDVIETDSSELQKFRKKQMRNGYWLATQTTVCDVKLMAHVNYRVLLMNIN